MMVREGLTHETPYSLAFYLDDTGLLAVTPYGGVEIFYKPIFHNVLIERIAREAIFYAHFMPDIRSNVS